MSKQPLSEDELIDRLNEELRKDELFADGMAFLPFPAGSSGNDMSGYSTAGPFSLTHVYARVALKVFAEYALRE